MATTAGVYYIDAASFADATGVWTNEGLSVVAPEGYYQYGGVYRRLLPDGTLLPGFACPDCGLQPVYGGDTATTVLRVGVSERTSRIRIITGDGTGAVRINIDPSTSRAIGVFANYQGTVYSAAYTQNFGYLNGPFYGNNASSVAAEGLVTTPIDEWDGASWVDSGIESVFSGDDASLQAGPYGNIVVFVPKTDANASLITLDLVSVFGTGHNFSVDIYDVVELESLSITSVQATANDSCSATQDQTLYLGRVASAIGGAVANGDVLFQDANAVTPAATGSYGFDEGGNTYSISVDANGVISSKTICP
jgi:hypothetical protein